MCRAQIESREAPRDGYSRTGNAATELPQGTTFGPRLFSRLERGQVDHEPVHEVALASWSSWSRRASGAHSLGGRLPGDTARDESNGGRPVVHGGDLHALSPDRGSPAIFLHRRTGRAILPHEECRMPTPRCPGTVHRRSFLRAGLTAFGGLAL